MFSMHKLFAGDTCFMIKDLLNNVKGFKYGTTLDLTRDYLSIELDKPFEKITPTRVHHGHWYLLGMDDLSFFASLKEEPPSLY